MRHRPQIMSKGEVKPLTPPPPCPPEQETAEGACSAATCSACRWWVEDNHTMAPTPQRECRNEKFLHESGWPSAGDASKSLTYQHYEGGQIWTGPNFGCVHFEPNDHVQRPADATPNPVEL